MTEITVFHGTRNFSAAYAISIGEQDLYHVHRKSLPTPNLSTEIKDAFAYTIPGVVLEFEVPETLLVAVGMSDPASDVQWYASTEVVPSRGWDKLPHDFRKYLVDPLHLIQKPDIATPKRWPPDLVFTVLSSIYFKKLHYPDLQYQDT